MEGEVVIALLVGWGEPRNSDSREYLTREDPGCSWPRDTPVRQMDLIRSLKRIILQLEMRDSGQLMREENNQVKGRMEWGSV